VYTPLQLAEAYLQTGELEAALEALNTHLGDFPNDDYARRLRIHVLIDMPGGLDAALADLDGLIMPTGSDAGLRGRVLMKMGDYPGAASAFAQAWQHYPTLYAETYARVLLRLGDSEQALRALAVLPPTWQWHSWNADIYDLRGEFQKAVEHYTAALDGLTSAMAEADEPRLLDAMRANELIKRGNALMRVGQFADADADYAAAAGIVPDDAAIPFNRGLTYLLRGDFERALRLCREAWSRANEGLREQMRVELAADPRYHALAEALLGGSSDYLHPRP